MDAYQEKCTHARVSCEGHFERLGNTDMGKVSLKLWCARCFIPMVFRGLALSDALHPSSMQPDGSVAFFTVELISAT